MEKVNGKTKIGCCSLCLAEKLHLIEYFDDIRLLNKRSEFINHCRQQNKLLLLKSLKKKTIVLIDTKYLSTLVESLLYFVLDAMRYIFVYFRP